MFKIKDGYRRELETPEIMDELVWQHKKVNRQNKNGENVNIFRAMRFSR